MVQKYILEEKTMVDWTEELTEEQKANIMDLVVTTVKEIRHQIDQDRKSVV